MSEFSNKPESIISAWSALEVLSPMSYKNAVRDLANGNKYNLKDLNEGLPWKDPNEKSKKNYKLYYHVVLGAIDMEKAVEALLRRYTDKRAERPVPRGKTIIATAVLDKDGIPVGEGYAVASSFSWGLPKALTESLGTLAAWPNYEQKLNDELYKVLYRENKKGEPIPVDQKSLDKAYQWLIDNLYIPEEMVLRENIAIKCYEYFKNQDPPTPLLLNSFYLNDLNQAQKLLGEGNAPHCLKKYLGAIKPSQNKKDLLKEDKALEAIVAPQNFPKSCWPSPGHYPLVLLQQAGVNIALNSQGGEETITAINGPPGTGKTTLLRDIVAELVTRRAAAMVKFVNPSDAFTHTKSIKDGKYTKHLYALDASLRGFEMVIASSNNKAVENVSAELPAKQALAEDGNLSFFKTVSDELLQRETWGTISAVLGNASNRSSFRSTFWWDDDVGLRKYFEEASGRPQFVDKEMTRKPKIIELENCPKSAEQAKQNWDVAVRQFNEAYQKSEEGFEDLNKVHKIALKEYELFEAKEYAGKEFEKATEAKLSLQEQIDRVVCDVETSEATLQRFNEQLTILNRSRPNLWPLVLDMLLRRHRFDGWRSAYKKLREQVSAAKSKKKKLNIELDILKTQMGILEARRHEADAVFQEASKTHDKCMAELSSYERKLGTALISRKTQSLEHAAKQALSPWYQTEHHKLRELVFERAIYVHKAFIDAAAQPLGRNLSALMDVFNGKGAQNGLPLDHLWSSLFLAVPSISTTFASVERMFGQLPPESLGWLLVDEAGQALPQAAVGALMRTKHAVVVGDPLQIEPVVTLPEELTASICKKFDVDPAKFNAPEASVQTVADTATPYVAEFSGAFASRTVGVPLLVHRRCAEPMFGISNAVAYDNLMVNKKVSSKTSPIAQALGNSRWIEVEGASQNKWSEEEGRIVLELLQKLKDKGIAPNLYIVTPFRAVQDGVRSYLRKESILDGWVSNANTWLSERVGTVHTVQGREAEAVIFILGAPAASENGARNWAGASPNLLNVAVTRAKESIYVVGNKKAWQKAGVFQSLSQVPST